MSQTIADQMFPSPLTDQFPDGTRTARIGAAEVAWDYGDLAAEYAAIRSGAARIDLSGAGLVQISGDDAYDLLQGALARDLEFVTPEQSLISAVLDAEGGVLDVVTAYHYEDGFRLETSLGRGPATAAHLVALAEQTGLSADITLGNDTQTIIVIEGPQAAKVLEELIDPDLSALPLSGLLETDLDGIELAVSRTGFTGEYGYKIFVAVPDVATVWKALESLTAVGIGALEVAMVEVRQPLVHRDIAGGADALRAGYAWMIDITKEEFHGRDAVLAGFEAGVRCETVGFGLDDASVTEPPASGQTLRIGDHVVGEVVHAVFSPGKGSVIGLARMRPDLVAPNLAITVGDDALVASTLVAPYVVPASWKRR